MSRINIKTTSNTATEGGYLQVERARGTVPESPSGVLSGDELGGIILGGYDGTNYVETLEIIGKSTENWADGATGSKLEFYTTNNLTSTKAKAFSILEDGNIVFGDAITTGYKLDIDGNVRIGGNLYIDGTSFITTTEVVEIADNLLVVNHGEVGAGVTEGEAGIQVDRGSLTDYLFIFQESDDTFRIGEIGDTQAVATREDSPTANGIAIWNNVDFRYDTNSGLTFSSGKLTLTSGTGINEFSTDNTLSGASDDAVPTEAAVKSYVDNAITALTGQEPGTAPGQLSFWDGTTWVHTETTELYWDDSAKKFQVGTGTSINEFSTDGTLAGDSDDALPTEKAVKTYVDTEITTLSSDMTSYVESVHVPAGNNTEIQYNDNGVFGASSGLTFSGGKLSLTSGTGINEFSTDVTLAGNSDDAVPTERAVKTYIENLVAPIDDGTATGQLTFWDGDSWTYIDTASLYWDGTNSRLGIGTATPSTALHVDGYLTLSTGTSVNDISTSTTMGGAGASDDSLPTQLAVKTYIENLLTDYIQGDSELYWDDVNNRLGIRTNTPAYALDVNGDGRFSDGLIVGNDATDFLTLALGTSINEFSIDGTLAGNSDDAVPTEKAVKTYVDGEVSGLLTDMTSYVESVHVPAGNNTEIQYNDNGVFGASSGLTFVSGKLTLTSGTGINEFSTDGTLAGNSDDAVPTEQAVKTYVDAAITSSNNIVSGTADGQMAFWDSTAATWTYAETSEIFWDDVNKKLQLGSGTSINEFSTDDTLAGDSDDAVPTEQAVKGYVDTKIPTGTEGSIAFYNSSGNLTQDNANLFWNDTNDNLGLGTNSAFAGGQGVFGIANADTVPNSNPSGGGVMYVEGGAAKWRSPSGTITTFGPAEPHCPVCGKDYMLEFQNDDDYFAMCMSCLAKELGSRPWILNKK